jgi:general secretion pathway protein G
MIYLIKGRKNKRIMQRKQQQGFTLIEILIVVAIIAILASVVLVGLGPTQQQGRDARRLSDLREVQTGLELYFNKCGYYPGVVNASAPCAAWSAASDWTDMATALTGSGLGIASVPNDPTAQKTYYYGSSDGTSYVIGAKLENKGSSAFNGYTAPTEPSGGWPAGLVSCTQADQEYCLSL